MTAAQIAKIMSLVDEYAALISHHQYALAKDKRTAVEAALLGNAVIKHYDTILAALRSMPAEPVAWGMRWGGSGPVYDCITPEEHKRDPGEYAIPLFAIPHTAPLSDAEIPSIEWLANVIRIVDGSNTLGAGELAEKITLAIQARIWRLTGNEDAIERAVLRGGEKL